MKLTHALILGSASPRRQQLMREAGFDFTVKSSRADEWHPPQTPPDQIAAYLARKKAETFIETEKEGIIMAADTTVLKDDVLLGKPQNEEMARNMLKQLSGSKHLVITGVAFLYQNIIEVFDDTTEVWFRPLTDREIDHYIARFKPFDKAGAYGIQEWIGMIGIEKISGSYFNVVGLPVHKVYSYLQQFAKE